MEKSKPAHQLSSAQPASSSLPHSAAQFSGPVRDLPPSRSGPSRTGLLPLQPSVPHSPRALAPRRARPRALSLPLTPGPACQHVNARADALAPAPSNRPSGPTLQWHPGPRVGAPSPEWARSPHHPARFFSPLPAQQAARACSTTPSAPGLPRTPLPRRAGPLSAPDTPGPSVRSPSLSFPPPRNCSARDDR